MKKNIFFISLSLMMTTSSFAASSIEKVLLINDLETWLHSGSSLFDWSEFRNKDVVAFNDIKQPGHIYRDFKTNSLSAEEKYKSIQGFSGHLSSIESNHFGDPLLIFNIGYVDKIYVNGLTRNEVINLKVPEKVNLLCVGFKMDYIGDIGATCSMFKDPVRFIAVNNIQHPDRQADIDKILSKNLKFQITKGFSANFIINFEKQCSYIDSKNYESCMSLLKSH